LRKMGILGRGLELAYLLNLWPQAEDASQSERWESSEGDWNSALAIAARANSRIWWRLKDGNPRKGIGTRTPCGRALSRLGGTSERWESSEGDWNLNRALWSVLASSNQWKRPNPRKGIGTISSTHWGWLPSQHPWKRRNPRKGIGTGRCSG